MDVGDLLPDRPDYSDQPKSTRLGPPDKPPCAECGLPHYGCLGHQTHVVPLHPCGKPAIVGGERCRSHGAARGSIQWKNAQRNIASAEVARLLGGVERVPVGDPAEALSMIVSEVIGLKDLLAGKLADLDVKDWRYASAEGAEQLNAYVSLYERALKRCGDFLIPMARLALDERKVRVTEVQAAFLFEANAKALADAGLDEDRIEAIKMAIARYLAPHMQ